MISVKEIGYESAIKKVIDLCNKDRYYSPQIEILDKTKMADFLLFLNSIEDQSRVDELGGRDNVRRYTIDKKLADIIHRANTSIACGIKAVMHPLMELHDYEKWEGGYIEGFARMDADQKFIDWFYWSYLRMERLPSILKKFEDHLFIL